MIANRGPTVISMPAGRHGGGSSGISCCCCRCCTCINLDFLQSRDGLLKLIEAVLGGICQSLLVNYGIKEADLMGQAFHGFLTTASACLMTTAILLGCYIISNKTFHLVKQSLFETVFNAVSCFLYLSASSYLGFAVNVYLYPVYHMKTAYSAYPAMTAVYYLGVIVGIVHGVDAFFSYRYFKGFR